MNYHETVNQVNEQIQSYKDLIQQEDIGGLTELKRSLQANRSVLRQLYCDSSGLYLDAKNHYEDEKARRYKHYRIQESLPQIDATNYSKLDTIEHRKALAEFKVKKDKAHALLESTTDVLIEISVYLKSVNTEIKYG